MRKATVIVLAWNQWQLTRRCLETLRKSDLAGAEVLLVDNGSTDQTAEESKGLDWLRVLRLPRNLGFVRGNNAGIGAADPESDIVLVNNDLVFTQHDWMQRLRDCAHARTETGVVGCRLVLPNGRLLHAGTYILPDTCWGQQVGSWERDIGQYRGRHTVEGVVFACAYLKREVVTAVGGLADDYQSYFEDTDYCLRAKEAGFETVLCGEVTLVHDEHGSTRERQSEFEHLFRASRETFQSKWRKQLEGRYDHELLVQSILNFPSGYAMSCREILQALDREGVRVVYRYVYGEGTPFPIPEPEGFGDYRLNVFSQRRAAEPPRVGLVYGQGDVFHRNKGRYKIGYTMLEVDRFPPEWVSQANRMDEVWVPSEFNKQGLLDSGVRTPIELMPLGVDPAYFHPGIHPQRNPSGEFVFLSVFEWGERKDPWLLLRAFSETFTADEPVRLICKIINRDGQVSVKREISSLRLSAAGGKISYLFNLEFPHYQLGALYRSADCFVAASRGEGWDMPLMEAMACGLPAIATDWGAHKDFFHSGVGYPLSVARMIPAVARCPYYEGAEWAEPDAEHLRHLLREVYERRDEARLRGASAAEEVSRRWTWGNTARRIRRRLEQIPT